MIAKALQYLVDLGQVKTLQIDGQTYSTEGLHHVKAPTADAIRVNTLSGLAEYILSKFDKTSFHGNIVHVVSRSRVDLLSKLFPDGQRETYMAAEAFSPQFNFGQWYDIEGFIISLQSCFVQNEDTKRILKVVGNIKESAVKKFSDDGVTQAVEAKAGIAIVEDVPVPNPVILAPYRTFIEVEQPESRFVFRMRQAGNGPQCALFEADGGAWKLEAMNRIKEYLEDKLKGTGISIIS